MASTYDLHLHTSYSYDALASVEEVFAASREAGLRCLAITDHHVVDGLPKVFETATQYPEIRVVPAAELTVSASIGNVDLVCYALPFRTSSALDPIYREYHEWQRAWGQAQVAALQTLGYDYTNKHRAEVLASYRPADIISLQGLTHVRNGTLREYFLQRGFIESEEGYYELLARSYEVEAFPPYPDVRRVAPAVHEAGGLIVIAHPQRRLGAHWDQADAICDELHLDGIETAHPAVPAEMTRIFREYCVKKGMISTAGSDCHTPKELRTILGRHGGPEEWLGELLARLPEDTGS